MFFSVLGKFLSFFDKKIRKKIHRKNLKGEKSEKKSKKKILEGGRKILELEKN